MRGNWRWVMAGAASIAIGLALWVTTFVLVPLGVVLVAVGIVRYAKRLRA